jgi:hypothetical protein
MKEEEEEQHSRERQQQQHKESASERERERESAFLMEKVKSTFLLYHTKGGQKYVKTKCQ